MSGDKGGRLLHAEYVLSASSPPAPQIQSALAGWLLHHHRKGAVDDFGRGVWGGVINKVPPSRPFRASFSVLLLIFVCGKDH